MDTSGTLTCSFPLLSSFKCSCRNQGELG